MRAHNSNRRMGGEYCLGDSAAVAPDKISTKPVDDGMSSRMDIHRTHREHVETVDGMIACSTHDRTLLRRRPSTIPMQVLMISVAFCCIHWPGILLSKLARIRLLHAQALPMYRRVSLIAVHLRALEGLHSRSSSERVASECLGVFEQSITIRALRASCQVDAASRR